MEEEKNTTAMAMRRVKVECCIVKGQLKDNK